MGGGERGGGGGRGRESYGPGGRVQLLLRFVAQVRHAVTRGIAVAPPPAVIASIFSCNLSRVRVMLVSEEYMVVKT